VTLHFTGEPTKSSEADRLDIDARDENGRLVLCGVSREALEDHAGLRDWNDLAQCMSAYARVRSRLEERLRHLYEASAPLPRGRRIIVTTAML
jgi:hypothetical protein